MDFTVQQFLDMFRRYNEAEGRTAHDVQTRDDARASDERTQKDMNLIIVHRISPEGVLDLGLPKDFRASMRAARAHFGC